MKQLLNHIVTSGFILDSVAIALVRVEIDKLVDQMKAKIANAEQMRVHTMLVIGNRDMEANAVSLRVHGKGNLGAKPRDEVIAEILLDR
jgi:threonyl-tRNA synthetase